ncbi:MAG: paraquat-inducible protein A [Paracoccaceae bacterium]
MMETRPGTAAGAATLMACPTCDALLTERQPAPGERTRCPRCHTLLRTGRGRMAEALVALALAVPPLMAVGLAASFVSLVGGGQQASASVLGAAAALASGNVWLLGLGCAALIAALPVARSGAIVYALAPALVGRAPLRGARSALRFAVRARPWSMAEVFVIGVAVAMVKLTGMAAVTVGPAFWAFALLGLVALAEDRVICPRSLWELLA